MSFSQAGGISPAARALFEYLFGDQHQSSDFIYEDELNGLTRDGVLTRLDLALSRDQSEKIYVETRMREQGRELFAWLEKGAHVYVCGDATRMARTSTTRCARWSPSTVFDTHGSSSHTTYLSRPPIASPSKRYEPPPNRISGHGRLGGRHEQHFCSILTPEVLSVNRDYDVLGYQSGPHLTSKRSRTAPSVCRWCSRSL